jgi:hypothetical protein
VDAAIGMIGAEGNAGVFVGFAPGVGVAPGVDAVPTAGSVHAPFWHTQLAVG